MILGTALLTVLLAAPLAAGEDARSLHVTVTDDKGAPVSGLSADEVAVVENGVARVVLEVAPAPAPTLLVFILDTSLATRASLKLNVAPAASAFIQALPEGLACSLWTTGDRPTKVVDFTTDRGAVLRALERVFPIGGNTLLDALPEATADVKKREGERSVVVALTGLNPELSHRDRWQSVDDAENNADLFMALSFDEGGADFEDRQKYDYVLQTLADRSGGRYETVLSPMAVETGLRRLVAEVKSQFRLTYEPLPDVKDKGRKIEVKVARPGVKVRVHKGKPD
jgi:VWFA-related protein